ncbi:hypothetical protein ACQ661_00940 [Pseudidiomarina sp. WS423]|uniref:hypothetical protein n=1 Tax=Pseudidiomarina sp. WS423 TaxID=3425124 RepID=UPI003D6FF760
MSAPWLRLPWQELVQAQRQQQLSHAHCIPWQPALGTDVFIDAFIALLLCQQPSGKACGTCKSCLLYKAHTHPDYHQVDVAEGKTTIGVDAIRALTEALQGTATQQGNKVAWIQHADRMTVAAANALLKTLEEPTANTYLILSPERTSQLLPTLRSRMRLHRFSAPALADLQAWLEHQLQQPLSKAQQQLMQRYAQAPYTALAKVQAGNDDSVAELELLLQVLAGQGSWPLLTKGNWLGYLDASAKLLQELIRVSQRLPEQRLNYPELQQQLTSLLGVKGYSVSQLNQWLHLCYTLRQQTEQQPGLNGPLLLQQQWLLWT